MGNRHTLGNLPSPTEKFDDSNNSSWRDYFLKLDPFIRDSAKLNEPNLFSGSNQFANAKITSNGILLGASGYTTLVSINKSSQNAAQANAGGGNAALYIQHLIDGTSTPNNNVNTGIRVQVQTSQTSSAAVNDAVAGYFGLYTLGVNIGGFGIHTDAYHGSTGANSSMYGISSEMFRVSAAGFTAGLHTRSIDGGASYFDNDYGFLASPSVGGTKKFGTVFSAGSPHTGVLPSNIGMDLSYTTCALGISIRTPPDRVIVFDGIANLITLGYNTVVGGRFDYGVAGTLVWAIENGGRHFHVANANTVQTAGFVASGDNLVLIVGANIRKLQLGVFP